MEKFDLTKIAPNIMRKFRNKDPRPHQLDLEQYLLKLLDKGIDPATGHAKPDPVPIAPPIGYKRHPTIAETVRDLIRSEKLKNAMQEAGEETFEEADDFDVDDEPPLPPHLYEPNFDPGLQTPTAPPPPPPPDPPPAATAPEPERPSQAQTPIPPPPKPV